MNRTIDDLLETYKPKTLEETKQALKEIVQSIVLVGLSQGNFFTKASFYGGTALRIFYHLNRFSEDLDFTLNQPDSNFSFSPFIPGIKNVAASYGIDLTVNAKEKRNASSVESAFAKLNTYQTFLTLKINSNFYSTLHKDEVIKIKFEVDKEPALGFNVEAKWLVQPEFAPIIVLDSSSLFAGKIHAILCRNYKNTVKGRDYYDFLFFVSHNVSPNLDYLRNKLINTGKMTLQDNFNLSVMKKMLHERFSLVDFKEAGQDAARFLTKPEDLSFFHKEIFDSLVEEIHE